MDTTGPASARSSAPPLIDDASSLRHQELRAPGILPPPADSWSRPGSSRLLGEGVAPPPPSGAFGCIPPTRSLASGGSAVLPQQDLFAPDMTMSLGSLATAVPPSAMSARALKSKAIAGQGMDPVRRAEPPELPAWPFTLEGVTLPLKHCEPAALRAALQRGLRAAGVDYAYNPLKWKCKCTRYDSRGGFCAFIVRAYKTGVKEFVIETQLREGSCDVFLQARDAFLAALINESQLTGPQQQLRAFVIPDDCPAAKLMGARASLPVAASAADTSAHSCTMLPPPPMRWSDVQQPPLVPELVEAGLEGMLGLIRSEYDDVACAGARSVVAAVESVEVCAAVGARVAASAPTARAGPSVARDLVDLLVSRSCDQRQSQQCRTTCAQALAALARNDACASVMVQDGAAIKLLDSLTFVPRADLAALRRLGMQAVRSLLCHSVKLAATAEAQGAPARLANLAAPPYCGVDPVFDASVKAALEHFSQSRAVNAHA